MARFRATIKGQRGEASRLGNARYRAMTVNVNGWDVGVRVDATRRISGGDIFDVYVTGGTQRTKAPMNLHR